VSIVYHIMKLLNPAIHAAGVVVCIWAFMKCRKGGYLLVGSYYFLVVCNLILAPSINQAIQEYQHRRKPERALSKEAQQQYGQELAALHAKYFPESPGPGIESRISYPIGPIILLLGVWFLARHESKSVTSPGTDPNSRPSPQL
jgi:hypothetical protein